MNRPATDILIVEDEPELNSLLQYHLSRAGHTVRAAADGRAALTQVKDRAPDLILLDLMLPDLDGFGVCEILRRDPLTATIPIIIISAWASPDSRLLGLELGAIDYITKPFSPHELVLKINQLLPVRTA